MSRPERSNTDDPTAERTADASTQSASGLSAGRPGPGVEQTEELEPPIGRTREERDTTRRRYDTPTEDDPVLPSDEPSLGTKI